ncbi:MAG: tetratricopeptide repeat protein [Planctomycetota bacterium]
MLHRVLALLGVLLLLAGVLVIADWYIALPAGQVSTYVGRDECARCHEEQLKLWTGSDHDNAMDHANERSVLGDFDDVEFTHFGVTSRMFRRDGKYFMRTDGPTGEMQDFEIKYTFGWHPLQQYLVEFPDGRVQCLPITWDIPGKRWFHLYPNEPIRYNDILHWTRPLQNWNYMCAECHSTNLQKNFNLATNTYHTTWSEIDVSCETCHGPGSLHVKLADSWSLFWDRRYHFGLPNLKSSDPKVEIETCAPCHSRRRVVYPDWVGGSKYYNHMVPELIDGNLYYADGQILEEDYVYGSFIQSLMYHKDVRCTDCHDAHTLEIKFREPGQPRGYVKDNQLCGQCHTPSVYDTPQHHHHSDQSQPGWRCVECHMPITMYMVVDPRRDHSIRIPRPDLTVSLKIPNACTGCHHDESKGETPQWAADKVVEWYGKRTEPQHFAYAIAAGREGRPDGIPLLQAATRRQDLSAMIRASAIMLLSRYPGAVGLDAALRGLQDPTPLVRATSVRALEYIAPPEDRLQHLEKMLKDPLRAVRTETARLLSGVPLKQFGDDRRAAMKQALADYMKGQEYLADQAPAHLNMGVIYVNLGLPDRAETSYLNAIRLDPQFLPARINLAMLYDSRNKKELAAEQFRSVIEVAGKQRAIAEARLAEAKELEARLLAVDPGSAEAGRLQAELDAALVRRNEVEEMNQMIAGARYSLGLLLAEDETQLEQAVVYLQAASEMMPDNPRVHYNFGLALQKLKRFDEAETALTRAYDLAPAVNQYLEALAILYTQQNRSSKALGIAQELVRREPQNPQFRSLLGFIGNAIEVEKQSQSQPPIERGANGSPAKTPPPAQSGPQPSAPLKPELRPGG